MPVNVVNAPKSVLSTWTALEVLSPPVFREPHDLVGGDRRAVVRLTGRELPWKEPGSSTNGSPRLFYQLLLGTLHLERAMARLATTYQGMPIEPLEIKGRALLAVIRLDARGVPIQEHCAAVSSFAWGLPRALEGKLEDLQGWPRMERVLNESLMRRVREIDETGCVPPLTVDTLKAAFDWLVTTLRLPPDVIEPPQYALRVHESPNHTGPPEPVLLNSFFLEYLASASQQFERNVASRNLQLFLGSSVPRERRDVLNDRQSLRAAVRPALFSPARWPGPGRYPLVLLQQAAVNLALRELKEHGILSVNGPPGTGKTTLLRDIVAALVTERARAMLAFDDPALAFSDTGYQVRAGNGRFRMHRLDTRLRGFEMLVASSNNQAVENISAELPGISAIASDALQLRYFKTTSDALQTCRRGTWGLIAAVLGNASNRAHFKKVFWWDPDAGFSAYLLAAAGTRRPIRSLDSRTGQVTERLPRIVEQEDAPNGKLEALGRWHMARTRFQTALSRSEALLQTLEALRAFEDAEHGLRSAQQEHGLALYDLQRHDAERPAAWKFLLLTVASRNWIRTRHTLKTRLQTATGDLGHAKGIVQERRAVLQDPIEELRARLGSRMVNDRFFDRERSEYQQEAPWLDDEAHRTRDEVFEAAMALHKAFIDAAAKPLRHNLGALMTVFGGRSSADVERDAIHADLWASLFLVVPVLSTTFASVDRMLGKLPSEALGWLLIDEAGQARPQAALGALMRTRRAVIVGDPMQIEPVVTLPETLTRMICRQFGVDPDRFNAPVASVQTLADRATSCMAAFDGQNGRRDVGVPLLIHRRCAEPMFGLSNAVAYDRLMINARQVASSHIRTVLGPSCWIDVRGEAIDKWCPEEGECVIRLLRTLMREGREPDLYIVTPFVVVQDRLREVILQSGVLGDAIAEARQWLRQRVGTVHVVQGREAEAVIFVLGAQGLQQTGARHWAGSRPNLLNVTVSRAKEAIYVVGNRSLWRTAGLFCELDRQLPPTATSSPEPTDAMRPGAARITTR